jgi:hypothetical protein
MSESTRVQRWRDAKRQHGLKALTVWLSDAEELRLKDAAATFHCSPSEMMQRAWSAFQPGQPSSISNHTDTLQIRQLIREELAAMQAIERPVTDTVTDTFTVMVTETPEEETMTGATAGVTCVTDTSNGDVTDTQGPRQPQPGEYGAFIQQVRTYAAERGTFTCVEATHALGAEPKKMAQALKALVDQGRLRKAGSRMSAVYQWA